MVPFILFGLTEVDKYITLIGGDLCKMIRMMIALLLSLNLFATFAVAEKLPDFVKKMLRSYYPTKKPLNMGLARPLGWGKGIYWAEKERKVEFIWFAYSNSDGWVGIELNTRLRFDDALKIGGITDSYQRNWETILDGNTTSIYSTNEWVDQEGYCKKSDTKIICDPKKGLLFVLDEVNKQSFISFELHEHLDWPKK